ncbi:MAG: hypothetical protein AB7U35_07310 [Sphingobium sp.]
MSYLIRQFSALLPARLRDHAGRRATGLGLAIVVELLLVLALLTLGRTSPTRREGGEALSTFDVAPPSAKSEDKQAEAKADERPLQKPQIKPPPEEPVKKPPTPPLPSLIPVSPQDMAAFDIAKIAPAPRPAAPARAVAGPSSAGIPGDTPLMGTAPNGEPLYAAQWYREPYDSELSGYLSTADGPGWGLIACKTEPEFRVDQCVTLDEYPTGSRIANAVLQAAWQFRVRPPRKGGKALVGEWVGIRIDYGIRRR